MGSLSAADLQAMLLKQLENEHITLKGVASTIGLHLVVCQSFIQTKVLLSNGYDLY